MKWYSYKKYKPYSTNLTCYLVRIKSIAIDRYRIEIADYEDGKWVDKEDYENLEDDDHFVTHFCIPDPIEIEE